MKAILEFDLSQRDEAEAHFRAIKSTDMASSLHEIVYNTKKSLKNKIEFDSKEYTSYEAIDLVFDRIFEILNDNNLNLDELIS